jgi:hypothetical protein
MSLEVCHWAGEFRTMPFPTMSAKDALMVVLLLPLSLAMDNSEFDHSGGSGGSGVPATAAASGGSDFSG